MFGGGELGGNHVGFVGRSLFGSSKALDPHPHSSFLFRVHLFLDL